MADPSDSRKSKRQARDPFSRYLKSISGRRGPGFLSLLALLFIGLKLTGHIDWSWVWVLAPLWFICGRPACEQAWFPNRVGALWSGTFICPASS